MHFTSAGYLHSGCLQAVPEQPCLPPYLSPNRNTRKASMHFTLVQCISLEVCLAHFLPAR
jgi:hypothetical protein